MVRHALALLASVTALGLAGAQAQDFPTRPITIISPMTPGATSDIGSRTYAQQVTETIGQRVIVENRPGGGGIVGSTVVRDSRPDGYALFLANVGSNAILQAIQTLSYDPVKDFTPIVGLFSVPNVLVVPAALNVSTVAELKALAATKKGGLAYGSQGIGSGGHLLGAMLQTGFGVPMEHVAYKGGAPLTLDLVAARVDLAFNSYSTVKQYVAEGRLRVLAVASPQRFAKLPNIPTMAEAGYPGIEMDTWYGLVGPAGMPKAVVAKLNSEFAAASRQPALLKRLDEIDAQAIAGTPEEFAAWLASEADRLGKIARANNVRAD